MNPKITISEASLIHWAGGLWLCWAMLVGAADAAEQTARLNVTADVGLSSVAGKQRASNGAGPTTPIRQNQNWVGFEAKVLLMAFDTASVKGWTFSRANLHLYLAKGDLYGVGLCEVLAPWTEPATMNGLEQIGGPCWQYAHTPRDPSKPQPGDYWAWPGSGFYSVAWAHPMARYSHTPPAALRRETVAGRFTHLVIPLDPALVASLAAGTSHGLVLTDDKGQVAEALSLIGDGYPYRDNDAEDIWAFTKDIQDPTLRPWLEVFGEPAPMAAPASVRDLRVASVEAASGTVTLEFTVPGDAAGRNLLAYDAREAPSAGTLWEQAAPLPRWAVPRPGAVGRKQSMPVWTLPPGPHEIQIRTVDFAGNRSASAIVAIDVPRPPAARLAVAPPAAVSDRSSVKVAPADGLSLYAVPDTVKIDPVSGDALQDDAAYHVADTFAAANPVFHAETGTISVDTPANGAAAFQLIVRKGVDVAKLEGLGVSVTDLVGPSGRTLAASPNVQSFRVWYVKGRPGSKRDEAGVVVSNDAPARWYGDACVPLSKPFDETFSLPAAGNGVESQTCQSVWMDVFVPRETLPGGYTGTVAVAASGGVLPAMLKLVVTVLPLAFTDQPTWPVELNCYGGLAGFAGVDSKAPGAPEAEWAFYRLAKAHRLMINALPYGQRGLVDTNRCPVLSGDGAAVSVVDWSPLDNRLGPLLDGSAFTPEKGYVGPGVGTPISHIYLPFHENWPLPLRQYYGDYASVSNRVQFSEWARTSRPLEDAFGPEYKAGYASVARQFAEHAQAKGWLHTAFQFFLNNKYYYKVAFFSVARGSAGSSFWLLDESVDYDDYAANAFFLGLCRQGVLAANTQVKFVYRIDVGQPEMSRGVWDDLDALWMCGFSAVRDGYVTTGTVRQKWLKKETFWHYGGGPGVSGAPIDLAREYLASWCSGSAGILPYWDTFGGRDWTKADDLSIYYTGRNWALSGRNYPGPLPGVRLKLMRHYQQDMELLQMLAAAPGWDRDRVRAAIAPYADDPAAPVLLFDTLTTEKLSALRQSLVETLHRIFPHPVKDSALLWPRP